MPKSVPKRSSTQVTPDPTIEKPTRRKFTAEYKLKIIAEANACRYGELGASLRRKKYAVTNSWAGDGNLLKTVLPG